MKVKQKALDEVNEITYDTKTGITTTTLVHTFKPYIDLFDGNEHIAHYENDTEFIKDFKKMKQENKQLKEKINGVDEERTYLYNKLSAEKEQLNILVNSCQEEIRRLKKQLEYLRSREYYNQLRFERDMLQYVVDNGKVSKEDKEFIDMTHRNTELLEVIEEVREYIEDWLFNAGGNGASMNYEDINELLKILDKVKN